MAKFDLIIDPGGQKFLKTIEVDTEDMGEEELQEYLDEEVEMYMFDTFSNRYWRKHGG